MGGGWREGEGASDRRRMKEASYSRVGLQKRLGVD